MLKTSMRRNHASDEQSRKRVITKARKEQNRIAAKAYRQRQKEKLRSLQRKGRGIQELRPRPPLSTKESVSATHDDAHLNVGEVQGQRRTDTLFGIAAPTEYSSEDSTVQQGADRSRSNNGLSQVMPASTPNVESSSDYISTLGAYNLSTAQQPLIGAGDWEKSTLTTTEAQSLNALCLGLSKFSNRNGFPNQDMEPELLAFPNSTQEDGFEPQLELTSSRSRILEIDNMPSTQTGLLFSHPVQPIVDPYANYIQLWAGSAFTAGLYIALSLNLNLELIRSTSWSSPFYRPTTLSDDPATLLLSSHIPYAPANLQPTLPQILFPHHAFLDLIPFPVFRARAITLASTSPPRFDIWDLKNDVNAGLVCWNPGNGTEGGNVQPWDARSWKAAPWFLKKWRMLIS